ncbi:NAD(P)/FAD-dependent oxidoreductase [Thiomonas sp. FB-6]|uniref:NAD(P)/FAD-dependent oxidoreductase n=1 Tax=Thiomonas sp. FB-6 TaxID=1158291 RepID=UPI00037ADEE5|nr:NAD/FAD-binding protein [Thiomonas sp. FB-6]
MLSLTPPRRDHGEPPPRVAIVGSGIAGLAAAWALKEHARLSLFEAGTHFGGHVHTVDATVDGISYPVDTGFLVLNERTYPGLLGLFAELGVELAKSDMSFSVQRPLAAGRRLEWSGSSLDTVFAQRANLLRPRFWGMLRDILRFNREATALVLAGLAGEHRSVGEFLRQGGYGEAFAQDYLLPMLACIWSCPARRMLEFPLASIVRFCHNHGLLQVEDRPQWYTVRGGARRYVQRIVERLPDARLNCPVRMVKRHDVGVEVATDGGTEWFDHVVLACHSDQALALLADADDTEREVLGAVRYQSNRALLHTDAALLPRRHRAWAAWNFESAAAPDAPGLPADGGSAPVCLHYLINRLQPVPFARPLLVSLNPLREPDPAQVLQEMHYAHPVFDAPAIAAQARVPQLQGRRRSYFCGAWCGHGFHEDGLRAGRAAAQAWLEQRRAHAQGRLGDRVEVAA